MPMRVGMKRVLVGIVAVMLAVTPLVGCGGTANSSTAPSTRPPSSSATATPTNWKADPRCSLGKLIDTEIEWMDSGVIPDNANNESSAKVLAGISRARAAGGSCEEVRARLLQELE